MPVRYARRGSAARPAAPTAGPVGAGSPPPPPPPASRSHVAAIVAVAIVGVGWYLATWTVVAPALLAFFLLSAGVTFLGTRLNPLSVGFYLTVKPSWTAIAAVFLSGVVLLEIAYEYWREGLGPVLPQHLWP